MELISISNYKKYTYLQARVLEIMVANGGNIPVSKAMRQAGYSEAMARNSHKLTKTKAFKDMLDRVGLTDDALACKHKELTEAVTLNKLIFTSHEVGKKLVPFTDAEIKKIVEVIPNSKLLYIDDGPSKLKRTAHFIVPNYQIVGGALNMAYRVKGYYRADNDFSYPPQHELTCEEKESLSKLFDSNRQEF